MSVLQARNTFFAAGCQSPCHACPELLTSKLLSLKHLGLGSACPVATVITPRAPSSCKPHSFPHHSESLPSPVHPQDASQRCCSAHN